MIPAYVYPGDSAEWAAVLASAPDVLIANPASGPGSSKDPAWAEIIRRAQTLGIRTIGYVATTHGAKPAEAVLTEVREWRAWYPEVAGIFFDEAPVGPLSYLRRLHGEARGADRTGLSFFNPGSMPAGLRLAMLVLPGSVWCTYEGDAATYLTIRPRALWLASRQCHIVYDCAAGATDMRVRGVQDMSRVGWGFRTADTLPNPFDTPVPIPS